MREGIQEHYGPLADSDRSFDVRFWQQQGPEAIFKAAEDMIQDY